MSEKQDPEAAKTAQTTSVPAVDLPRLVRLLPCPFCGSDAKTYCETVTCSNPACKMHFAAAPDMHTPEEWNERWDCDECVAYKAANEQLREDLRKMDHRIRQLLKHRGHVAAEAVMDKMAEEISPQNVQTQPIARHES